MHQFCSFVSVHNQALLKYKKGVSSSDDIRDIFLLSAAAAPVTVHNFRRPFVIMMRWISSPNEMINQTWHIQLLFCETVLKSLIIGKTLNSFLMLLKLYYCYSNLKLSAFIIFLGPLLEQSKLTHPGSYTLKKIFQGNDFPRLEAIPLIV